MGTAHIVSAGLALLALVACQGKKQEPASVPEKAQPAAWTVAAPDRDRDRVQGTCVIKPSRVVRLKSQLGGEVKEVRVEQGERVGQGQILASMNVTDLNIRKARTRIELARLIQRAELLRFQITRAEKEFSVVGTVNGAPAPYLPRFGKEMAALVERRNDLRDNELSQSLNRLDLRTIEEQLHRSVVVAPFDGVVLSRTVEPGMVIGSGSEGLGGGDVLFEVADPSKLVASCVVKESDAMQIAVGSKVTLQVDGAPNRPYAAKISAISPIISSDAGISRRDFRVELGGESTKELLPGMNAEVTIDTEPAIAAKGG